MYHYFVKRRIRYLLGRIKEGDFAVIVAQFTPDAKHWFSGTHALGGKRSSHELINDWYSRLSRVFPELWFEPKKIIVSGFPWKTYVVVECLDHVLDRNKNPLVNQGILLFTIRWGKVSELHVYCDTQKIQKNLEILASQGVTEAVATPIQDSTSNQ